MKIKEFYKKLSVPMRFGLGFLFVDLIFWVWFIISGLSQGGGDIWYEGLMGMVIFHMPASLLLPVAGRFIVPLFQGLFNFLHLYPNIAPVALFLFLVGTMQYFLVGYLIGKLVVSLNNKFGKNEDSNSVQFLSLGVKTKKALMVVSGVVYLLFSLGILTLLIEYIHIKDFERFRMMRSTQGVFIDLMIFVFWLFVSVIICRYYRKNIKKDRSFIAYLIIPIVILVIVWFLIKK